MTQQVRIELNDDVERKLLELPSATTPSERRLALHYAATYWDGTGDVFENGPLLGGATRALAMGMGHKEGHRKDALLHSYDWFSLRQPLDLPDDVWEALVSYGSLTTKQVEDAHAEGTFLSLFEALHRPEDYWKVIRPHVGYLPGHRDDVPEHGENVFAVEEGLTRGFSLAFIDGCKSWYGTKHWFRELLPYLKPDTDFLFQDFGHYTCFWLPMLVGTFRERWELIAYVDHTYVWRLKDPPSVAEVEINFPDEPTCLRREDYEEVLGGLAKEAVERNDQWGTLILQMQLAAAYAYLDLKDEAREILDFLLSRSELIPVRPYVKQARVSPAYTPEGQIEL